MTEIPTATRPWYRRKRFLLPMASAVVVTGLAVAAGAAIDVDLDTEAWGQDAVSVQSHGSHLATADVELGGCRPDDAGHWTPRVTITNHSSKASSYLVSFDVETRGGHKLGDAAVVADRVAGGARVGQVGISTVSGDDLVCRATSVTRVAADS